jgi:hypothetical protein
MDTSAFEHLALRKELLATADEAGILRPLSLKCHDPGEEVVVTVTGISPPHKRNVQFTVLHFAGGGFAGQVYRIRIKAISNLEGEPQDSFQGLVVGHEYAVKILKPPSSFRRFFRDLLFRIAYQTTFAAQSNYHAARTGLLWHVLIRRGAGICFGTERVIAEPYGIFFDEQLRSYGEFVEWVNGRTWKLEIEATLFSRMRNGHKKDARIRDFSSREYLGKRHFMGRLVQLMHEMGAGELARQYEWWTMKSQPNVLKRLDGSPVHEFDDLVAIDFRSGLALLPFLPMSPADVRLIAAGLLKGKLVQFDRGNLSKLKSFTSAHEEEFHDLSPLIEELETAERRYRESIPDVTHQGISLLKKKELRRSVRKGVAENWQVNQKVDEAHKTRLQNSPFLFVLFYLLSVIPVLGKLPCRLWGNLTFRRHIGRCLRSAAYLRKSLMVFRAEKLIAWSRQRRVPPHRILHLLSRPVMFTAHLLFVGWMPASLHRFFTDRSYTWERIRYAVSYPVRFYRDAAFREEWLMEQIRTGREEGMLTEEEEAIILAHIKDPFIQKYLKCVAVHICTLPITQVISIIVAFYAMIHFGRSWKEGIAYAAVVLAAFQGTPVSPGSLVRGSYVVYLIVKERNIKNYWLAALVSFWHYIGYLGFPLQMVATYPALARFMGGSWATKITRIIPVFGEKGALLEHMIFDVFFNLPVSVQSRLKGGASGKDGNDR